MGPKAFYTKLKGAQHPLLQAYAPVAGESRFVQRLLSSASEPRTSWHGGHQTELQRQVVVAWNMDKAAERYAKQAAGLSKTVICHVFVYE